MSRAASSPIPPLSHPHKVFWPDEGLTKLELARYYVRAFDRLRPWVAGRLLTMERCPDGMSGECFYQKEAPSGLPAGTLTKAIRHGKKVVHYVVGGSLRTQVALVNLGCIAIHAWASRAAAPRRPDWACFDIDPTSGRFADAVHAARDLKELLDAIRLTGYVKTSGGRGLHVFVPIRPGPDADDALHFAEKVGAHLAALHPARITVEQRLARRRGRVYMDPFRNGFGQTVVTPWSVRRKPGAPVSTPLSWDELDPRLSPGRFRLATIDERLKQRDPWEGFFARRQSLPKASRALDGLLG
jgi:bifunctional non-homologous end joining protein LigD